MIGDAMWDIISLFFSLVAGAALLYFLVRPLWRRRKRDDEDSEEDMRE